MPIRRSKFLKRNGPTSRLSGDCAIDGCTRPMFRKGLCCAHFKRMQRNKPVDGLIGEMKAAQGLELAEVLDPMENVIEKGSSMVEARENVIEKGRLMVEASSEDDDVYHSTKRIFIKACEQLMLSRGWSPPPARKRERARTRVRGRE